jgi:hypothetical protein
MVPCGTRPRCSTFAKHLTLRTITIRSSDSWLNLEISMFRRSIARASLLRLQRFGRVLLLVILPDDTVGSTLLVLATAP